MTGFILFVVYYQQLLIWCAVIDLDRLYKTQSHSKALVLVTILKQMLLYYVEKTIIFIMYMKFAIFSFKFR